MDLNKVRLVEACYEYLLDKLAPSVKESFKGSSLVFENNQTMYQFQTFQENPYKATFIEYKLAQFELSEIRKDIRDVNDLYKALQLRDTELSTLANVTDVSVVKALIFKLLSNADLDTLSEIYPDLKEDNIVYNLQILGNNIKFPIYQFSDDSTFRLVAIT